MGRSQETFNKKEVRNKKEKKRKEKEKKRLLKKENKTKGNFNEMIAYVDQNGLITSTPPAMQERQSINIEDIEISVPKKNDEINDNPLRFGTVTFYNTSKGFGFIKGKQSQDKIFVHVSNLIDQIAEGNEVSFEIEKTREGYVARNVRLVNKNQ